MFNKSMSILFLTLFVVSPSLVWADTLCPDPQVESSVVPSDLARVQEDIDRLSLCVERTKLLQELNELTTEGDEIQNGEVFGNALPVLDPSLFQPVTAVPSLPSVQQAVPNNQRQIAIPEWSIRRVWGKDGRLKAQLVDAGGIFATVQKGEILTDGKRVKDISTRGVVLTDTSGKDKELTWQETVQ